MNTRRAFLGSISSLGLGACVCKPASPIPEPPLNELTVPSNLLAPTRINAEFRLTAEIIDPHCHIFNASDVQVGGFLAGPVANGMSSSLLRSLIKALAPFAEAYAKNKAISAYDEMLQLEELERQLRSPTSLSSRTTEDIVDEAVDAYRVQLAEELAAEVRADPETSQIMDELTGNPSGFTAGDPQNIREFIYQSLSADESSANLAAFSSTASSRALAGGVFTFIGHMLSPRFHNLRSYQKTYSTSTNSAGITRCMASLVDMDYWLGSCDHPRSLLRDQIILNQRIANLADGYVIPIVSYNPWTDLKQNDASIALVKEAITKRGFKGVKIYPPLGYFPHGNATSKYPTQGRRPDLTALDARLANLFEECRDLDVPVMAHANESMGQTTAHNQLAGPSGWQSFFRETGNRNSRINLAHAGGEHGGGAGTDWTKEFVQIMKSAPHLYADLGYWDTLPTGNQPALQRLLNLLDESIGRGEKAADRFMFGTDWFMLTRTPGYQQYAASFQRELRNQGVNEATLEKLFSGNVKRLYNLV